MNEQNEHINETVSDMLDDIIDLNNIYIERYREAIEKSEKLLNNKKDGDNN